MISLSAPIYTSYAMSNYAYLMYVNELFSDNIPLSNRLKEVIEVLPKTKLLRDLGIHHQTFEKCINAPERFTLKQIYKVASLIESDEFETLMLFHNEYMLVQNLKSKNKKYNGLKRKIGY